MFLLFVIPQPVIGEQRKDFAGLAVIGKQVSTAETQNLSCKISRDQLVGGDLVNWLLQVLCQMDFWILTAYPWLGKTEIRPNKEVETNFLFIFSFYIKWKSPC